MTSTHRNALLCSQVVYLDAKDTFDEAVRGLMNDKLGNAKAILDGKLKKGLPKYKDLVGKMGAVLREVVLRRAGVDKETMLLPQEKRKAKEPSAPAGKRRALNQAAPSGGPSSSYRSPSAAATLPDAYALMQQVLPLAQPKAQPDAQPSGPPAVRVATPEKAPDGSIRLARKLKKAGLEDHFSVDQQANALRTNGDNGNVDAAMQSLTSGLAADGEAPFASESRQLEAMGFKDKKANLSVLRAVAGDVNKAVNRLVTCDKPIELAD